MIRKSSERKSRTSLIAQGFGPDPCILDWLANCGASNVTRKEVNEVNDTGAFAIKNWTAPPNLRLSDFKHPKLFEGNMYKDNQLKRIREVAC